MSQRIEYSRTQVFNEDQVYEMKKAQYQIRVNGFKNLDENKLATGLAAGAGILSMVFMLPTPVTLTAAVANLVLSMIASERETIENVCKYGEDDLFGMYSYLKDTPGADLVRMSVGYLEFVDDEFRIVQGAAALEYRIDGAWIPA